MTDKYTLEFDAQQLFDSVQKAIKTVETLDSSFGNVSTRLEQLDKVVDGLSASFNNLGRTKVTVDTSSIEAATKTVKASMQANLDWALNAQKSFSIAGADIGLQVKFQTAIGAVQELINKEVLAAEEADNILADLRNNIAYTYTDVPRTVQRQLDAARQAYATFRQEQAQLHQGNANLDKVGQLLSTLPDNDNASLREKAAFAAKQSALKDFVATNKVELHHIETLWDEVDKGSINHYSGALSTLQQKIIAVVQAHEKLGIDAQTTAAANAPKPISRIEQAKIDKAAAEEQAKLDKTAGIDRARTVKNMLGTLPEPATTDASIKDKGAFANAEARLLQFVEKHKIAQNDIQRVWDELANGEVRHYEKELDKLQQHIIRVREANQKLLPQGEESVTSNTAAQGAAKDIISGLNNKTNFAPTEKELTALARASLAVQEFARKSKLSAEQIKQVWGDVSTGVFHQYDGELGNIEVKLGAVAAAHKNLGKELEANNRKLTELNFSWQTMFRLLVTQSVAQVFSGVVTSISEANAAALELTKSITNIQTIDNSHTSSSALQKRLLDLSGKYGQDSLKEAEGAYQALSNQIGSTAETLRFLDSANKYALVANTDMASSVDTLSAAFHAYNKEASDSDNVSAILAKTIELGKVTGEELSHNIGRLLVPAAQLKVSFEEINAAIATTTISGINQDVASTLLRNTMLGMIKPTKELAELFNSWGYNSASAAVQGLTFGGVLSKIADETKGSQEALSKLFPDMREFQGMSTFAGHGLDVFNDALAKNKQAIGEYDAKVQLVTSSSGRALDQYQQKIKALFIDEISSPTLNSIAQLTDNFNRITPSADVAHKAILGVSSILGGGLTIGAIKAAGSIGKVITAIEGATWVTGFWGAAIMLVVGALLSAKSANDKAAESIEALTKAQADNDEQAALIRKREADRSKASLDDFTATNLRKIAESKRALGSIEGDLIALQKATVESSKGSTDELTQLYEGIKNKIREIQANISATGTEIKKTTDSLNKTNLDAAISGANPVGQIQLLALEADKFKRNMQEAMLAGDKTRFDEAKHAIEEIANRQKSLIEGIKSPLDEIKVLSKIVDADRARLRKSFRSGDMSYEDYVKQDEALKSKLNSYGDISSSYRSGRDANYIAAEEKYKQLKELEYKISTGEENGPKADKQVTFLREQIAILEANKSTGNRDEAYQALLINKQETALKEDMLSSEKTLLSVEQQQLSVQKELERSIKEQIASIKEMSKHVEGIDWTKAMKPERLSKEIDNQIEVLKKQVELLSKGGQPTDKAQEMLDNLQATKDKRTQMAEYDEQQRQLLEHQHTVETLQQNEAAAQSKRDEERARLNNAMGSVSANMPKDADFLQRLSEAFKKPKWSVGDIPVPWLGMPGFKKLVGSFPTGDITPKAVTDIGLTGETISALARALGEYKVNPNEEQRLFLDRRLEALQLSQPNSSNASAYQLYQSIMTLKDYFHNAPIKQEGKLNEVFDYTKRLHGPIDYDKLNPEMIQKLQPTQQQQQPLSSLHIDSININGAGKDMVANAKETARVIWREIQYMQAAGVA